MSYLAEVKMPEKEPEIEMNEIENREEVSVSEISEDFEEEQGVEEDEVLPPPPTKKDKLKSEDIFRPKKAPAKKTVPEITPLNVNHDEPIVPELKPVKKKRVMSEKQLEALARGREKRAQNKKAQGARQAQPKPQPTYSKPASPSEPPAEYEETPPPTPQPRERMYSQKEVEELIFQGVSRYDSIRKVRKEEKRKEQAKKAHEQKVFNTINSAMNHNHPDPWASAFTF